MSNPYLTMYQKGAITAAHLAAQSIHMVDPADPSQVLGYLPSEILDQVLEYTKKYQSGRLLSTYGILPAADQVEAAKAWIEEGRLAEEDAKDTPEADWNRFDMKNRVVAILQSLPEHPDYGRHCVTIYQIAIEFAKRHGSDFKRMGRPLGGKGAGYRALTIYMANQLSKRIKSGDITEIEMQMMHPTYLSNLSYKFEDQEIIVTNVPARYPVSVFRLGRR